MKYEITIDIDELKESLINRGSDPTIGKLLLEDATDLIVKYSGGLYLQSMSLKTSVLTTSVRKPWLGLLLMIPLNHQIFKVSNHKEVIDTIRSIDFEELVSIGRL